jgi:hypothetical protein
MTHFNTSPLEKKGKYVYQEGSYAKFFKPN